MNNISTLVIIILIIIMVPLFCDIVFRISVRRERRTVSYYKALQMSRRKKRSLVIFTSPTSGIMIPKDRVEDARPDGEEFEGDIDEIISNLKYKSCVILLIEVLEYLDDPQKIWNNILDITGDRAFSSNLELKSPKFIFDYRLKHMMPKPYFTKNDYYINSIHIPRWISKLSTLYKAVFSIVPKQFFLDDPLKI